MQPTYIRNPVELDAVVTIGTTTESLVLDFKRTIHDWDVPRGTPDRDKLKAEAQRETCKDVAQFANTNGGCLLIGVAERLDPIRKLKVADAIHPVTDPDAMRQWIEDCIRNYLVPATFSHDIAIVADPRGAVLAVNVPPSIHLITLWDSEQQTIECLRRTSHGKDWMNPDELERHIMNGSRATKLAFDAALTQASVDEVNLVGCYWERGTGFRGSKEFLQVYPNAPVTVKRVDDQCFELLIPIQSSTKRLKLPFGFIEQVWVGSDGRMHLSLAVRVLRSVDGFTVVSSHMNNPGET
jgi:hypothetical protein